MKSFLGGYAGKNLHVDLSTGDSEPRDIDIETARQFIGGMGLGSRLLYNEVGPDVDPLSPDNILVFATGPLTGTRAPCSGRNEVTTKSPLTGILGTGNSGGFWGTALKRAGYDAVVIKGKAKKPVYLWISDEEIRIRDASHLWERDALETTDILKKELGSSPGSEVSVTAIGQAGENLVKYACSVNDYYHTAARCGAGAVMGSKKLKAIAVRGKGQINIAQPNAFQKAAREATELLRNHPKWEVFRKFCSFRHAKYYRELGCLPGKNFQTGVLPQFVETRGLEAAQKYITKPTGACHGCPMACFNLAEVKDGKYAGLKVSSATFFSAVTEWGAKCAIGNLPAIWKCKELCHRLGMDYVSASGSIALTMELYDKGILTKKDVDGLELSWGNEDAVLEMLHKIAYRKGFGDVLAEGSLRAARAIGKGAEKYLTTIKGLEMAWTDPRAGTKGWLFGYLTSPRGGDNVKGTHFGADRLDLGWEVDKLDMPDEIKAKIYGIPPKVDPFSWEGKATMTKWFEDLCSVINALVTCIFPTTSLLALGPSHYSKLYSACTGWETAPSQLMEIGERIFTVMKAYAVREGLTRKDDDWPERFYREPLPEGPAQGAILSKDTTNRILDEYYELRGWNKDTGHPTTKKLAELGLRDIAAELERLGITSTK